MKRAVIMAGGTGGHVFPALAVAESLREQGYQVSWLGTRRGIESTLVPKADIAIDYINIEGVRGRGVIGMLKAPFLILLALWQAYRVLRTRQPDVVAGFGGFVSGPGGLAARLMRRPLIIHEQNAIAGTTNKILARFATKVLTGFSGVFAKGVWVGNPVRQAIVNLPEAGERYDQRAQNPIQLLVLGGSQGALAINELVPAALSIMDEQQRPVVRHQCGQRHAETTLANYAKHQVAAKVEPFIGDMAEAYGWADLIVCRAGALTVAEIAAAGVAAILVPLPNAIDDHQTHNAAVLAGAGAAISIAQRELTPEKLSLLLSTELGDRTKLLKMAEHAKQVDRFGAARRVVEEIEGVVHG